MRRMGIKRNRGRTFINRPACAFYVVVEESDEQKALYVLKLVSSHCRGGGCQRRDLVAHWFNGRGLRQKDLSLVRCVRNVVQSCFMLLDNLPVVKYCYRAGKVLSARAILMMFGEALGVTLTGYL